jgi:Rrf2 family protein
MLSLTRKTDYALIALTHMARDPEGCCSAREIATRYRVPLPLLMNILKLLTRQGFAKSARGPRGGYTLAMSAEEITLYDVIHAVEGPIQLMQCVDYHEGRAEGTTGGSCGLMSSCPMHSPIQLVHNRLVEFLSGVSLADVVKTPGCKGAAQLAAAPGDGCREAADLSGL